MTTTRRLLLPLLLTALALTAAAGLLRPAPADSRGSIVPPAQVAQSTTAILEDRAA